MRHRIQGKASRAHRRYRTRFTAAVFAVVLSLVVSDIPSHSSASAESLHRTSMFPAVDALNSESADGQDDLTVTDGDESSGSEADLPDKVEEDGALEDGSLSTGGDQAVQELPGARDEPQWRAPSTQFDQQWPLNTNAHGNINVDPAWRFSRGEDMLVAVIDSGVDASHETFRAENPPATHFLPGYNFITGDGNTNDIRPNGYYHGTAVASLIASPAGGPGLTGVAPRTTILPLVVDPDLDNIANAIQYAVLQGVDVINISLGSSGNSARMDDALRAAERAGIPIVVATGNQPCDIDTESTCAPLARYTRVYSNIIAVTSINADGHADTFTGYGARSVALAAPGVDIFVPLQPATNGSYAYSGESGTSLAAPYVSGTVAMMRQVNPSLSPARIRDILIQTVTPDSTLVGRTISGGFLNTGAAVEAAIADGIEGQRVTLRQSQSPRLAVNFTSYDRDLSVRAASEVSAQQFDVERVSGQRLYRLRHHDGLLLSGYSNGEVSLAAGDSERASTRWRIEMAADQRSYVLRPERFPNRSLAFRNPGIPGLVLEESASPQTFRLVTVGGMLGEGRTALRDHANPSMLVTTSGASDVSMAELEEDSTLYQHWNMRWNPEYGGYRIDSTADRRSALGFQRTGHEIRSMVHTNQRAAHWIPERAANGSVVFFNAERTTQALLPTDAGGV